MIAYIKGELTGVYENSIIVETGGIGYNIFVPLGILDELPQTGNIVKLFTYMQVKEDGISLFGFANEDELTIFKMLIGVSGIGPKGAIAILSVMTTDDLRIAVTAGDSKAISKAPGVGSKTAQRIIIELKDKVNIQDILHDQSLDIENAAGINEKGKNEVALALVSLGYTQTEAFKAVNKAVITEGMTTEEILKASLKVLAF